MHGSCVRGSLFIVATLWKVSKHGNIGSWSEPEISLFHMFIVFAKENRQAQWPSALL